MRTNPDAMLDLFPEPERNPKRAPEVDADSHEAKAILAELRRKPQADDHCADSLGFPLHQTRKIFRALFEAGHIVDVGDRIETPTYKFAIVWHPTKP